MPIEITMPALSPTMTEGNIVKWVKKEGDKVKSGDIIAEIETDKATMELEASNSGTMGKIVIQEGSEGVQINTLIALLLKEGEEKTALENYTPKTEDTAKPNKEKKLESKVEKATIIEKNEDRVFASPLAKRIAENKNINLASVEGTGPNGRIIKADVESFKPQNQVEVHGRIRDEVIKLSNVRKVIAKRLLESKTTVPHFYLSIEINMEEALEFRIKANKCIEGSGSKLSLNDLIIKASSLALRDFPNVNSSFTEDGILMYGNVDVSVAVSTDGGLITPIIKNADRRSLTSISNEMKELVKRARENKLKPEEFQGGGFSISNLGMYGITNFSAIINPPQSAILAVGGTVKKPIFCEEIEQFIPIDFMTITLSADHRVIDGVLGAEFLNKIKFYLENPIMLGI